MHLPCIFPPIPFYFFNQAINFAIAKKVLPWQIQQRTEIYAFADAFPDKSKGQVNNECESNLNFMSIFSSLF